MTDQPEAFRHVAAQVTNTETGQINDMVVDSTTGDVVSTEPLSGDVADLFAAFGVAAQDLSAQEYLDAEDDDDPLFG